MIDLMVDTNVLIYARDQRSAFHAGAVRTLTDPTHRLFVPTKVISEYFAVCSKLGIEESKIWTFYGDLKRNAQLLYPGANSMAIFETLIKQYQPRGNQVFDLAIVSVALANGISQLATVNTKDFSHVSEIQVTPISSP